MTQFHQHKCREACYSGFDIQVIEDMQELEDDKHVVKHASHTDRTNTLLYTKPAWHISFTRDKENYEKQESVEEAKVGHAAARTSYTKNKARHEKIYKLVFPTHCKLTNDPFRNMTDAGDQELEPKLLFLKFDTGRKDKNGKSVPSFVTRASWKVIDLSTKSDVDDGIGKKKGSKQLDDAFAGLEI